ncbi:Glyoxylase, beta-lactamase superfamily II [Hyunsoonleella jejuensis]|uniref:Glyoxylase, beta-lactamase superfamily II n=1 Tax=Hyunsoonleella jejuensis TaxID=419940 RepID=A0A1H9AC84_9FLAO|nr:MBL fold metallo-hydrolase [Hyunsoonleella jejuensis]SEP74097.1 Glyoxylase, beta-lactamase superfamily II [Hyunsoonleella jejuensis]
MLISKSIPALFFVLISLSYNAQSRFDKVTIETIKLTDNTYMLVGAGGNIGVSIGEDGILIIDNQFAPLTDKIVAALKILSDKPVKIVMNTHHHGDHTGGNENFGNLGATIMAHDNVKKRLKEKSPAIALPVITFNDKLTVQMNGEAVMVIHVDNAHTDGDALLYFTESNVLHTGDTYFNGRYPYMDLKSGGSVDGYINAVKTGLMLIDENTKIIPGHGELSNKTEYETFLKMLETLKANVMAEIKKGKTEDEVASNTEITKTYDDLDYGCCYIKSEKIRRTIYRSLKKK